MDNQKRCKAKTKSGDRCKRVVSDDSYCYDHYQLWLVDKVEDYIEG